MSWAELAAERLFANGLSAYLTLAGALMGLGGAWMLALRLRLWLAGGRAEGVVVSHEVRMQQHFAERRSYMPVVAFRAGGRDYQFQSRSSGPPSRWPVGRRVQVVYLPGRPQVAEIASPWRMWGPPASLMGFGLALLLAAVSAGR